MECPYCGHDFGDVAVIPHHVIPELADEVGEWACFGSNSSPAEKPWLYEAISAE